MSKPEVNVLVFSKFCVPEDESLEDEKWANFYRILTQSPGHSRSKWGRISECPNYVLLVTIWDSPDALSQFKNSSSYHIYWSTLSRDSSIPPEVCEVDNSFILSWFYKRFMGNISIVTAYFPVPEASNNLERINAFSGLSVARGLGPGAPSRRLPQRQNPKAYWVNDTRDRNGINPKIWVYLCVSYWYTLNKGYYFPDGEKGAEVST
ncbi:uncharacterized protein N7496_009453 [Penicillium cataractarum]|uniref:ABM domain-containing protein n=1 Tax=Penicillium cataractarum TaxID=2100454 RepID=A0A9W9RP00_9EURO|nr:uncharacterized protein N7496_009453 [Penicillium cataractarum]KAJ5363740.1 hypothetical protein N7496_009453 [Penicillium cataractarum]